MPEPSRYGGFVGLGPSYNPAYQQAIPLPELSIYQELIEQHRGEHTGNHTESIWFTRYLTPSERAKLRLKIKDGKLVDTAGEPYDSRPLDADNKNVNAIFVLSVRGDLYAHNGQATGEFQHSSFLAGSPVAAAGHIGVEAGVVKRVTDGSGHYKPSLPALAQALRFLSSRGLDLSEAQFVSPERQIDLPVSEFMRSY